MFKFIRLFLIVTFTSCHVLSMTIDEQANLKNYVIPTIESNLDRFFIASEVRAVLSIKEFSSAGTIQVTEKDMPELWATVKKVFGRWRIKESLPITVSNSPGQKYRFGFDTNKGFVLGSDYLLHHSDDEIAWSISHECVHYQKGHAAFAPYIGKMITLPSCWLFLTDVNILYPLSLLVGGWLNSQGLLWPASQVFRQFEYEADACGAVALDALPSMVSALIRDYFIYRKILNKLKPTIGENLQIIKEYENDLNQDGPCYRNSLEFFFSDHPRDAYRIDHLCKLEKDSLQWQKYKKYLHYSKWDEWCTKIFSCCRNDSHDY